MSTLVVRDERGLTLIETLTALMLFGMVAAILYSFLFMGASMYKRVSVETQMRNQADALFGSLITELRDAVHVKQGSDAREIIYVKRSADPDQYLDAYRMEIDDAGGPYGVTIYAHDTGTVLRRFELTSRFVITDPGGQSYLKADGTRAVQVKLIVRRNATNMLPAENPIFTVESRVPLRRLE